MARRATHSRRGQARYRYPRSTPDAVRERSQMKRAIIRVLIGLALLIAVLAGIVAALNLRDEEKIPASAALFSPNAAEIARGEYLARAGGCVACHTARGGAPYAGGRAITTPFGTIYSSNITPDAKTGIGTW